MPIRCYALSLAIVAAFGGGVSSVRAADVVVQPSSGSGFVVKDASGANERLRVQESGAVSLPGVVAAPVQAQGLCMSATGQLGPCSGGTGSSYTAATGLTLTGTTFAVAPTYQLPQTCTANQVAQWNGTAWACGAPSGGATLPAGTVNQTLRYNASNTLVANPLLQAFSDGGFLASHPIGMAGGIPATGAGERLMWYAGKAAFRVGYVDSTEWDDVNIGAVSVAMGRSTTASGFASVALGHDTTAAGDYSLATGYRATANQESSTALGFNTLADNKYATAMGIATRASGESSTAMGELTVASGASSTAMGSNTKAIGKYATAMGYYAVADGDTSIAIGSNVGSGGYGGSFIFGDKAARTGIANDRDNQFLVFASGGINLYSGMDPMNNPIGAGLASGTSSWTTISDRNAKTAVQPVDARDVLKKVAALPLNTWQYKTQEAKYRHMGPMAQDFYSAFHLGESDKGIDTVDADGVALAAIQGLNAELMERDAKAAGRLNALRDEKDREIAALRTELTTRVAALESVTADMAEMKAQLAALRRSTTAAPVAVAQQP